MNFWVIMCSSCGLWSVGLIMAAGFIPESKTELLLWAILAFQGFVFSASQNDREKDESK